ncbi:hypothetical protein AMTRI_Chr10g2110 [Amborella trichopoda]
MTLLEFRSITSDFHLGTIFLHLSNSHQDYASLHSIFWRFQEIQKNLAILIHKMPLATAQLDLPFELPLKLSFTSILMGNPLSYLLALGAFALEISFLYISRSNIKNPPKFPLFFMC